MTNGRSGGNRMRWIVGAGKVPWWERIPGESWRGERGTIANIRGQEKVAHNPK